MYEEIKAAQEDGVTSYDCCKQHKISLVDVNKVFSSKNWEEFTGTSEPKNIDDFEDRTLSSPKNIKEGERGYFRALRAKNNNTEISLSGVEEEGKRKQLTVLNDQIKSSWAMIRLLESRKSQLQRDIQMMERYIQEGTGVIEKYIEE